MEGITLKDYGRQYLGIAPGTTLRGKDLDMVRKLYSQHVEGMDKARPAFEPSAAEVALPDGSKRVAYRTSPNSAQYEQPYQAPVMQLKELEDGTIAGVNPVTLEVIKAWDKQTGGSVKAAKKLDPFAFLGGEPQQQSRPSAQSGATTLEPPPSAPVPAPAQASAMEPAPASPAQANAPTIYSISGEADYAKVPAGATVSWNGQTFTKR